LADFEQKPSRLQKLGMYHPDHFLARFILVNNVSFLLGSGAIPLGHGAIGFTRHIFRLMSRRIQKDSLMNAFILLGSKGGCGRTASSVVLATGLAAMGMRPLHLQVTMSGCLPVIALAEDVPFATTWLPDESANPDAIRRCIARYPECASVVIDTPKLRVAQVGLPDFSAAMLLPMRRAPHEIEVAVRDYQELQSLISAASVRDSELPRGQSAAWILPVTWPPNFDASDFATILGRFDASITSALPSPSVLMPGIREIPRCELDALINGASFRCSPMITATATIIAKAAVESAN
jgi:hypothetical protein